MPYGFNTFSVPLTVTVAVTGNDSVFVFSVPPVATVSVAIPCRVIPSTVAVTALGTDGKLPPDGALGITTQ